MFRLILALVVLACLGSDAFAGCGVARRTPVRSFFARIRPASRPQLFPRLVPVHGVVVGGCANGVCPALAPKIVPLKK